MTTQTEALSIVDTMKLALEALELNNREWKATADSGDSGYWLAEEQTFYQQTEKAIAAIKEALNHGAMDSYPNGEAQPAVALEQRSVRTSVDSEHLKERSSDEPVALQMDVIVVNLVREGINKHRARELAEHFIKHTTPPQPQSEAEDSVRSKT
ncbi:hypothetical protein UFOVP176_44 [uncultured Caudovirales phage]|uniref:Uncharacterized protein n=1 Tax=uncultured Caudovirales phage TaxID=2100421 RepID=A0A6J7WIV5_9CAUD|nr:hypothetical protein UFOVP176_44 [uncultured Caudovirales phage]